MKKILVSVAIVSFFVFLPLAQAAEFLQSGPSGQLNVPASEPHKNLYAAGSTVTINGPTTGDLTVAGGTVVVDGEVLGGLMVAGGNILISSKVHGNARIGGASVSLNAPMGGDVLVGAGTVDLSDQASVAGDLVVGAGTVSINSAISGNVYVGAGSELSFGPKASVVGTVYYRGVNPAVVDSSANVPNIRYNHIDSPKGFQKVTATVWTIGFLVQLLALWLVGFLVLRFRSKSFVVASGYMYEHFWKALGIGLLGLLVVPIAVILLFVTFVGYYAGLIVLFAYILMAMLATIVGVLFLGQKLVELITQKRGEYAGWIVALAGAVSWQLLKLIPVVGWIVLFAVYLVSFGAMIVLLKKSFVREE